MLDNYLNQLLTWKHAGTTNEYNEPTHTITSIKGRKETGHKLIRNSQGQEVVSSACVFTKSAIVSNDLIDDRLVVSSEENVDLGGNILWYEAYLS